MVGGYELEGEIGRGAMGRVFRARSPAGKTVAIKLLKRNEAAAVARFERERRLLAELGESVGFVPLLDSGTAPEGPYLVMPFVPGGTLRAKLAKGPLGVADAVELARALASALAAAHERGIVHRDVKPENVLYGARPLLADLGIAKHFGERAADQSVSLSQHGDLRGTAGYMAPEQMADAKTVGAPADVYALGAVLYECLAGEPPFVGTTVVELLSRVHEGRFAPLAPRRPDAPAGLVAIVERCLARDPAARFADGAALARALDDAGGPARRSLALKASLLVAALAVGCGLAALVLLERSPGLESGAPPEQPAATAPGPPAAPAGATPAPPVRAAPSSDGARLALEQATAVLYPETIARAGAALEGFSAADFALCPKERKALLDQGRQQIETVAKRETEAAAKVERGFPVYEVLRKVDPGVEPPDALVAAAATVLAEVTLRKTSQTDLVEALIVYLPHASAAERADPERSRGWGRIMEDAINEGIMPLDLLGRASTLLLEVAPTTYSHFVRGRVLATGFNPNDASRIARAEAEFTLARRDGDSIAFFAASSLAVIRQRRGDWEGSARLLGEEWAHRDPASAVAYRHYAYALAYAGQPQKAAEVLREGAEKVRPPASLVYKKAADEAEEALRRNDDEAIRRIVADINKAD